MNINPIKNGIVIDHITAGKAMQIYTLMGLDKLDCSVAIIKNVESGRMGKKDIVKIDFDYDIDIDVLGYIDSGVTVNVIKNGEIIEKRKLELPEKLTNVIFCKNPRCITSCEQELPHIFKLTDKENKVYRCLYCETKAKNL
ncbi:MAG: aspartate carbamoyltransferase regulatory subunit [Clostridia bacterium]|nr:aspartate carbamoyltransferase regulatory subunit [Clostridia bacterium]